MLTSPLADISDARRLFPFFFFNVAGLLLVRYIRRRREHAVLPRFSFEKHDSHALLPPRLRRPAWPFFLPPSSRPAPAARIHAARRFYFSPLFLLSTDSLRLTPEFAALLRQPH